MYFDAIEISRYALREQICLTDTFYGRLYKFNGLWSCAERNKCNKLAATHVIKVLMVIEISDVRNPKVVLIFAMTDDSCSERVKRVKFDTTKFPEPSVLINVFSARVEDIAIIALLRF